MHMHCGKSMKNWKASECGVAIDHDLRIDVFMDYEKALYIPKA